MPQLIVSSEQAGSLKYDIDKEVFRLGRSKENDIVINDRAASRMHAEVCKTAEGYILRDAGSNNGTFVNENRIDTHLLQHSDVVRIGNIEIAFIDEPSNISVFPDSFESSIPPSPAPYLVDDDKAEQQQVVARIKASGVAQEDSLFPQFKSLQKKTHLSDIDLEKGNKILWVLYQISRQLNRSIDFDELLNTIMDLIFQVIQADYGFLVLLGETPDEIIPKVVKYNTPHANGMREFKISRTILNKVINEKTAILTSNAMTDERFGDAMSILVQNIRSVLSVPLWRKDEIIGMIQLYSVRLNNIFTEVELDLITTISNQMAMVIEQANLNEKILREEMVRNRLERFHSPDVVDLIVNRYEMDESALMSPDEKNVTILFTDIVNFTPLAEQLQPSEVSQLLNHYFQKMTDVIYEYNGTLDKYIGDGIMAVFGAPIEREDDSERAVLAAIKMRKTLIQMMQEIREDRRFKIRIGINSGKVVAGNMGSPKRMDYTVVGDTVNTAARLESIAQPNQILIGQETNNLVINKFKTKGIGQKSIKGKNYPISVYEVMD